MIKFFFLIFLLSIFLVSCKKEVANNSTTQISNSNNDQINFNYTGTPIGKFAEDIIDVEGNRYKSVLIGSQHWLAENMKVTMYNDKTPIRNVIHISDITKDSLWEKCIVPAWSYLDNKQTNKYLGLLYNFYVIDNKEKRNVCPVGWHVPNNNDWNLLINYLGGNEIAGDKLKEIGDKHWLAPNYGTNTSLFTAFPVEGNEDGHWWSTTDGYIYMNNFYRSYLSVDHFKSQASIGPDAKYNDAIPIRCIKD